MQDATLVGPERRDVAIHFPLAAGGLPFCLQPHILREVECKSAKETPVAVVQLNRGRQSEFL